MRHTPTPSACHSLSVLLLLLATLSACGADELTEDPPTRTRRDASGGEDVLISDTSGASLDTAGSSGTSGDPDTSSTSGLDVPSDTSGTSGTSGADTLTDLDTSGTSGTSGADTLTDLDTSGTSGTTSADTSGSPDTSGGVDVGPGDRDGDGVPDNVDNCPDVPNASQSDVDGDGLGDACDNDIDGDNIPNASDNCPNLASTNLTDTDGDGLGDACDPDADNDGVPNEADRWPTEGDWPTVALPNTVYAHTASRLYAMDVYAPYQVTSLGDFTWPSGTSSSQMTDIAIDQYGVIYGTSFNDLFICRADNGQCRRLGALPSNRSFNGLTWLPAGSLLPDREVLVGVTQDGIWYRLDIPSSGAITATQIGNYAAGYTSSGDAFAIQGTGVFAAVNKSTSSYDFLIEVTPTGGFVRELGPIGTYTSIWGVAGWSGKFFGFDSNGDVLQIAISPGAPPTVIPIHTNTGISWWGAGVRTVIIN